MRSFSYRYRYYSRIYRTSYEGTGRAHALVRLPLPHSQSICRTIVRSDQSRPCPGSAPNVSCAHPHPTQTDQVCVCPRHDHHHARIHCRTGRQNQSYSCANAASSTFTTSANADAPKALLPCEAMSCACSRGQPLPPHMHSPRRCSKGPHTQRRSSAWRCFTSNGGSRIAVPAYPSTTPSSNETNCHRWA